MTLSLLALLSLTAVVRADGKRLSAAEASTTVRPRSLSALDIKAEVKPFESDIQHCYRDVTENVRGAGHLDLVFVVTRHGFVESLAVETPGLPAKLSKKIETCVRRAVETVKFPARKTHTTATVPYFFQRTAAPNAGPQLSCWNPKGCS